MKPRKKPKKSKAYISQNRLPKKPEWIKNLNGELTKKISKSDCNNSESQKDVTKTK